METTKIKKKAGRISPTPMGDYDNTTTYRRLDWVYYGGTSYICKKNNTLGISPADTDKWQKIIELPTELKMIFDEATTRENIISGEKLSVILGKIQKCIADIKDIAFTGSYNDLSDKPTSLKNPNALTIKFNGTTQSTYDGSIKKEVDVTPSVIAAVPATNVLTSKEQVLANTNASNIASAVALKNINNDLVNSISAINSNLAAINSINITQSTNLDDVYIKNKNILQANWALAESSEAIEKTHVPGYGWFFVLTMSYTSGAYRIVQIAIQAFYSYDISQYGDTYIRSKHDNNWLPWIKMAKNN